MRFTILGPVEVLADGSALPEGSGRERCVLAVLLMKADRTVTTDQIIDALWLSPPHSAKAQVHNVIRSLRRRLRITGDDELIVTRPLGYELRLGAHELDLAEFRRLVDLGQEAARTGDHAAATGRYDEALALWRGPALADVPDDLAAAAREALGEERFAAHEARIRSALALGDYDDALRDLERQIERQPYRERLHEMRMRALAAVGRRADALAAYQQAYQRLTDDLGIEPGPTLRDLERRILRGESTTPTAASAAPPRQLPALPGTVTGRDKLVTEVSGELRRLNPGPVTALLVGPGGIGKTTLALAAAHRICDVLTDGQLFADLRGSHADPAEPYDVLGAFLRALGVDGSSLPDSLDERQGLYRTRLADSRTLILLDDAADERQVRPLLPGTAGGSVLVTSRQRLGALVDAARWSVPVLPIGDAVDLLARIVGRERLTDDPKASETLVDACGRLPLAVSIAAARLALNEDWSLDEFATRLSAERHRLDELSLGDLDVRSSIALSYEALDDELRTLFRRLGLSSEPQWPAWVAAELIGADAADQVDRGLDALADVHLVEPIGRDPLGQSRFRLHDLVAEFAHERALAEDTEIDRDAAVRRVVDGWLALATEADPHVAHGLVTAEGLTAPSVPARADAPPKDLARAWFDVERSSLVDAVGRAVQVGAVDTAAKLALRTQGFLAVRARDEERSGVLQTTFDHLPDGHDDLRRRLSSALFAVRAQQARYSELPALADQQVELARRLGDKAAELGALRQAAWAARNLNRLHEAIGLLDAALAIELPEDQAQGREAVVGELGAVYLELGEPERGEPLVARMLAAHRHAGPSRSVCLCLLAHAEALMLLDRLDEAQSALDEMLTICHTLGDELGIAYCQLQSAQVDIRAGRLSEAAAKLDDATPVIDDHARTARNPDGLRAAADLAAARGRWAEALELLGQAAEIARGLGRPLDVARELARAEIAHRAVGEKDAATDRRREWRTILDDLGLDDRSLLLPPFLVDADGPP